ncbi:MAG TPA: S-adenosylmethionine:tRNA ribosyltransferase-isomerase [Bacteroidales bacterium]|nr:S-adenosylmethionine:tRNA ribosyltransferase-isomerase [Bacteroidales bacterium]HRZ48506.1 S-adenosylmethionine:tRNA ribosyltransferase-isomerase [Bacteroidales bacterium]
MIRQELINPNDYQYDLPKERIAQYPLEQRDLSKLLVMRNGEISEEVFRNLPEMLPGNALLLFNNTRVIRARVLFTKPTGAQIEIFFLNPLLPSHDHEIAFGSGSPVVWECIIGNAKKWKTGDLTLCFPCEGHDTTLVARLVNRGDESSQVELSWEPAHLTLASVFEAVGHVPLPPYIQRADEPEDAGRYQTVYARHDGSVAAPTAGLHFTEEVLEQLNVKGIRQEKITLHVGAGTFKPVSTETIANHVMHREEIIASRQLLESLSHHEGPVIPVGTTSVRSVESLYWFGVGLMRSREAIPEHFSVQQWEPYRYDAEQLPQVQEVFGYLAAEMATQKIEYLRGDTSLMIVPGYRFAVTKGLITNFHQPGSTLLLLVSALVGGAWKKAYQYALEHDFRFLSYGDACLFI